MLEETDDMLQRLQLQVEEVQTERIARENDQILNRADELAEHCSQIGNQVAALEQFNQHVLMQGRNVLVAISNTEQEQKPNARTSVDINVAQSENSNLPNEARSMSKTSIGKAEDTEEPPGTTSNLPELSPHSNSNSNEDTVKDPWVPQVVMKDNSQTSRTGPLRALETEAQDEGSNRHTNKPYLYVAIPQAENVERVPSLVTSSGSSSSDTSSDNDDSFLATSESDQSWGGGAFSLSHTIRVRSRRTMNSGDNSSSQCHVNEGVGSPCQEFILQMLKPKVIEQLAQKLGLPPGMLPCLKLEVARLQLCLAINRYKTVECDVGCEQDESEAWDTTDSSDSDTNDDVELDNSNDESDDDFAPSFDDGDSFNQATESDQDSSSFKSIDNTSHADEGAEGRNDIEASCVQRTDVFYSDTFSSSSSNDDSSYIPSVPAKPRTLSTSSEESSTSINALSSSANNTVGSLDLRLRRLSIGEDTKEGNETPAHDVEIQEDQKGSKLLTETSSFHNDWFSVVGNEEHSSTEKYVQEKVGEDFGHSTDSSSDSNDDAIFPSRTCSKGTNLVKS